MKVVAQELLSRIETPMRYSAGGSSFSVVPDVWLLGCICEDVTTNDACALECLSRAALADSVHSVALVPGNTGYVEVGSSRATSPPKVKAVSPVTSTAATGRNVRERGEAASPSRSPS